MAEKFIEFIFEDEHDILLGLEREQKKAANEARQMLDNIAAFGLRVLESNISVSSGYTLLHASRSDVKWRPGGAGGGGEWEAVVGITRGSSRHPIYVELGTGIYGLVGWYITPQRAPFLVFRSTITGRLLRKRAVLGQKPQRFLYRTWREVQIYAAGRVLASAM